MNELLYNFLNQINFLIVFAIIALICYFILTRYFKKFKFDAENIRIYGIFMGLSDTDLLSLSLITIKYIFLIYTLLSLNNIDVSYLIINLILTVLFIIFAKNYRDLILEIANCLVVYVLFKVLILVFKYMSEVRYELYLAIIVSLGIIFLGIYITYFMIRNINAILIKNRYIRKEDRNVIKKI